MANKELLTGALQENVLTLLCFDPESVSLIKGSVDPALFSNDMFRHIADVAMDFHNQFNEPIGDHLPDLFESILRGPDERQADLYNRIIRNLKKASGSVNRKYVLSNLSDFVRQRTLAISLTEAAGFVRSGDLDEAERIITQGMQANLSVFDPGLVFGSNVDALLDNMDFKRDFISLGIPALDEVSFGPAPGELLTVLAPTNRGKSWALLHMGRRALMMRKKVLHITLEMSENKTGVRYLQNAFAISRRQSDILMRRFKVSNGEMIGLVDTILKRPALSDEGIRTLIRKRARKGWLFDNLIVKQFPTGALTISGLESYLDVLARSHHFAPDLLIVDYADLFKLDSGYIREDTGLIYKELRRVATTRNIAVATASQSNRSGEKARIITLEHLAEDYSKAATSDMVLTYTQSEDEHKRRLARLFVAKNRDEEAQSTVLITQQYATGQFLVDSMKFHDGYWDTLTTVRTAETDPTRVTVTPRQSEGYRRDRQQDGRRRIR